MAVTIYARRRAILVITAMICLTLSAATFAQRRYGGLPAANKPFGYNNKYDGRFRFARLTYTVGNGGYYYRNEPSWQHGYPLAEQNLMQIMESISSLDPHIEDSEVLAIDDPELGKFPVSYMVEASFWITSDKEALAMRNYLLKGGFIIFDDFRDDFRRGSGGWANFETNMGRVIPGARWVELTPDEPIFHSFFEINNFNAIKQAYDAGRPMFMGLYEDNDPKKRLLCIANFNTDISDWWEFSGQGLMPIDSTNEAYKFGVNYLIYGMVH